MRKLSFLLVYIFINGCIYDLPSQTFTVYNYSDSAIYIYYTCSDSIKSLPELRLFENFKKDGRDYLISPNYRINAYTYGTIPAFGNREKFIDTCKNKTLKIFFIKEITMRKKPWREITQEQAYIKKMELTYKDLEKLNWIITYTSN